MSVTTSALWASLPTPALILDAEDRIRDVNPMAETFLNASSRALDGHLAWTKITVEPDLSESVARVRAAQTPMFVNGVDVGTGSRRPVSCNIQIGPLADRPDHVLVLLENRELVGRMSRAMSSKTAAKSAIGMAEMLAHEIKNPLAGITGAAQLISMNANAEDRELTDLIVAETRRVLKLLEQVEDFGNVRPPERRAVNIHDVLDRARKSASVGFASHMVISEAYDPSLPPTWADPDQLQQVVVNLLKNAAEAGKSGGRIQLKTFYEASLKVRRADGTGTAAPLQIEVIDDGPGIAPELQQDVFEPFVSGRENGTGLGLALISKIVAEHDGWIAVESKPGRTAFRVSLPVAPKEAQ
ncbi:two-component system sensor histidine kinase NtrB [Gymnodinialimonas ceratoperidinii]|uniref:histidine kinase n=1 Tax=Gymnodinialimonas ceratoperidinii TaxID=2856823 RepID=A0A8F6TUD0_9RHOB|nr:ATP-binding protein [Gymnodinialimonas ceratoperidinii]QXT38329.1 PAS domain-containing sensor histidine kinase [Gymnodinialimonas ceratoperidinii]